MDFRKELAKELGLGAIAENTMLDDYVKACEVIAVRYHESEVEKFRLGGVVEQSEQFCSCSFVMIMRDIDTNIAYCSECGKEVNEQN